MGAKGIAVAVGVLAVALCGWAPAARADVALCQAIAGRLHHVQVHDATPLMQLLAASAPDLVQLDADMGQGDMGQGDTGRGDMGQADGARRDPGPREHAWIGRVDRQPVVVTERDRGSDFVIDVAPWRNEVLGRACRVSATVTPTLALGRVFCRANQCGTLPQLALSLAARFEARGAQAGSVGISTAWAATPELERWPTFGRTPDQPDAAFDQVTMISAPVAGAAGMAVVGHPDGCGGSCGTDIVALWKAAPDGMQAMAGVEIIRGSASVSSTAVSAAP